MRSWPGVARSTRIPQGGKTLPAAPVNDGAFRKFRTVARRHSTRGFGRCTHPSTRRYPPLRSVYKGKPSRASESDSGRSPWSTTLFLEPSGPKRLGSRLDGVGRWHRRSERRSASRGRCKMQTAPEGVEPVLHVRQAGAPRSGHHVESAAIIDDVDINLLAFPAQAHLDCRRRCVLRHVLECFQGAEVESCFDLLWVAADGTVGLVGAIEAIAPSRISRQSPLHLCRVLRNHRHSGVDCTGGAK